MIRSRVGWTTVIAACMLACAPGGSRAQQPGLGPARSTREGVYSEAQARTGSDAYALLCRSCHTPNEHSVTIKTKWSGRPLSELFLYVQENMPKSDPGILQPRDNADVLAFLLQTAGLPPGSDALPFDAAALGRIQFDTMATKARLTGEGVKP